MSARLRRFVSIALPAFLVDAGIDPSRLEAVSRGDTNPDSTLDTEIGHAKNRRVTFKVQ